MIDSVRSVSWPGVPTVISGGPLGGGDDGETGADQRWARLGQSVSVTACCPAPIEPFGLEGHRGLAEDGE